LVSHIDKGGDKLEVGCPMRLLWGTTSTNRQPTRGNAKVTPSIICCQHLQHTEIDTQMDTPRDSIDDSGLRLSDLPLRGGFTGLGRILPTA
jgi:hypothetical protein